MEQGKPSAPSGHTAIPSQWIDDTRLTYDALGVLAHMASYPPRSTFTAESLAAASEVDNEMTVQAALVNLADAGYLRRAADGWAVTEHPDTIR